MISWRMPEDGEGTSVSTLSVDTSKSGSSRLTRSPTDFSQRVIVPSTTVSPSCGIVTSGKVQPPSGQSEDCLPEGLGQRWMRQEELCGLLRSRFPVDSEVARAELLGHPGTHEMNTEDPARSTIRCSLRDHLHHPIDVAEDPCPAVAGEGIRLRHDVQSALTRLLLGEPRGRDLRMTVDRPRHPLVVDGGDLLAKHRADRDDRLGETDMGELRSSGNEITDCPYALGVRALVLVGHHEPGAVEDHASPFREKPLGSRSSTDRDHHELDIDLLTTRQTDRRPGPVGPRNVIDERGAGDDLDAALTERPLDDSNDISVAVGQDRRKRLDEGDPAAEVAEQRGELATNGPATDHRSR